MTRYPVSCFNSLQTGRHIQTSTNPTSKEVMEAFQFPSNGKAHSDVSTLLDATRFGAVSIPFKREGTFRRARARISNACGDFVSIPFKREGTFRPSATRAVSICAGTSSFNSLQTGRHIQTFERCRAYTPVKVSIPFKREGTFRRITTFGQLHGTLVSIPFKREGTFRPYTHQTVFPDIQGFNSLQTGRHIQTIYPHHFIEK